MVSGVGTRLEALKITVARLSPVRRKILALIYELQPCSLKTIARYGFLAETTVSSSIRELIKTGYVAKKKSGREVICWIPHPAIIRMFDFNHVRFGSYCLLPKEHRVVCYLNKDISTDPNSIHHI
jgi:predicted transcriptional regulator